MNSDTLRTKASILALIAFFVLAIGSSDTNSGSSSTQRTTPTPSRQSPADSGPKKATESPKTPGFFDRLTAAANKPSNAITTAGFYFAGSEEAYLQASRLYAEGNTKKIQELIRGKKIAELVGNVKVEVLDYNNKENLVRFRETGKTIELWTHQNAILTGSDAERQWTPEALRLRRIEKGRSPWDGSHHALTEAIKMSMNDPDSYKHVTTDFWDMKTHVVVRTTFRGRNAFGGVVTNWVKAKCELDGKLIEILESGP
jgi:hypothetical protein